ncbi:Homocysteine S-methyltransferase [Microdochium bolleyi]|uniref:Homocysteine S-methyltransferase n=1 Tax=Microdochium bolleyi TaxID=196109 RepID=A0A136J2P2_9PEZI|nr:Homocysteine S-methyltransferase [Microdochium bolleyi]
MSETQILILDGGLGTSLEDKYGLKFTQSTPLWSSHPLVDGQRDVLLACQQDFGRVPVDILLSATYQVSVEAFARTKTPQHPDGISRDDMPVYLEDAVAIAEQAKQPTASIALSLGPYGACMVPSQEYSGRYDAAHDSEEALHRWHRDRLEVFAKVRQLSARTEYVAFETVPRADEIRAIRRLFRRSEQLSVCIVDNIPGSTVDELVEASFDESQSEARPWAIGINCTKLDKLEALVELYEAAVARLISNGKLQSWPALALYPDGTKGEVYNTETKVWEVVTPQDSQSMA